MRRYIGLFILFIFFSNLPAQPAGKDIPLRLKEFQEKLKLSDKQVNQIKQLFISLKEETTKIDSLKLLSPKEKSAMARQAKNKINEELKSILTPEQYNQYLRILLEKKIDKQLAIMEIKVNLTDAQTQKIRPLVLESMLEIQKIRDTQSLDKMEKMMKIKDIMESLDGKIIAILKEDQMDAYERYKEERKAERRRAFFGDRP